MDSDEITDFTPNKRTKVAHTFDDSDLEYGDQLDDEDIMQSTPVVPQQRNKSYGFSATQLQSDISGLPTQPTQPLTSYVTQPTQPLRSSDTKVQVAASSSPLRPTSQSRPSQPPPPYKRPSILQSVLAGPRGTQIRPPQRPQQAPIVLDSDDEEDPVVDHGASEDETQSKSLRPTYLKGEETQPVKATPARKSTYDVVQETPRVSTSTESTFASLMQQFQHSDDMASSYANSRRSRPQQTGPSRAQPIRKQDDGSEEYAYVKTLEDIQDYSAREKVQTLHSLFPDVPLWRLYMMLRRKKYHYEDTINFFYDEAEKAEQDQLSSVSPVPQRGQKNVEDRIRTDFSQKPAKAPAKQEVKEYRTINDKYNQARKESRTVLNVQQPGKEPESVKPKQRKLVRGNNQRARSSSPVWNSPIRPVPKRQKNHVVASDEESGTETAESETVDVEEVQVPQSALKVRLLKFFNECTIKELAALCAQPEDDVKVILDQRPFASLDSIDAVEDYPMTKTGKKRQKPRQIGEKILGIAREMWEGYDAVDDLVEQCERLGGPIREALRGWGVGDSTGELQLMNIEEAHDSGIGTPSSAYSEDKVGKKSPRKGRALKQPENMGDVVLKDYQIVGLNWLHLLWTKRISCILADDMGLGKTCQVIAFLAQLKLQGEKGPHLIIVTGSTLENWLREFQRFAPDLRVLPYYGSQSERSETADEVLADPDAIDVIVTTYDMATKPADNKFMRKLRPTVCVYDEAHALRNTRSQRYTSLMRINSDFRILLTGTPLQNNLQELVAILAFIMPDIFDGKRDELDFIFKHRATTKDADHSALLSSDRIARARTMMTPFILRRKKHQVLDLPAKHRRVEWCSMTPSQATFYSEVVSKAQQFYENKDSRAKGQAAKASSNIIMALRKAAIHPMLSLRLYTEQNIEKILDELMKHREYGESPRETVKAYLLGDHHQSEGGGDYRMHRYCQDVDYLRRFALKKEPWMDSGKTRKFAELVKAYQENGDRVLVFSQFTTMMDILEAVLETLGIKFMRLDGSTKMDVRQDMLDQFATDESITVFMLSTKAGGAGINLACANKVIIFDSGFNPQDDVQAENRAHRVGQTREVDVVRLLTEDTIEVQIHAVGESKMALDERVAGESAGATESKDAEEDGARQVEAMLINNLKQEPTADCSDKDKDKDKDKDQKAVPTTSTGDLAHDFKAGMEQFSVQVKSKQARF